MEGEDRSSSCERSCSGNGAVALESVSEYETIATMVSFLDFLKEGLFVFFT